MIDNDKVFGLNAKTGQLDVMTIQAQHYYGPHDDYVRNYSIVESNPSKEHPTCALLVDTWSVSDAKDIKHQYAYIKNHGQEGEACKKLMGFAGHIRGKHQELLKTEAESQIEEGGIEMQ